MGDARHQARKSDHNLGNAVDITHDPASGCDGDLIASLAIRDSRVTYVIWNKRIYSKARAAEGWRPYKGTNPHTKHCHISIRSDARGDTRTWAWASAQGAPAPDTAQKPPPANKPAPKPPSGGHAPGTGGAGYPNTPLKKGMKGAAVRKVQARLRALGWDIGVDGIFGSETDRVVRAFQRRRALLDDGIVGPRTWKALFG
ncbi:peptidoglycan-binding domain-containing protein [Polyangium aurulentum]|uniref:peptidoglycan-binding domain-containing protein n=1 Tax=Polyangium aurulentum TaxID=2567896 RepID=UPI0010AE918E|nr:peptidoglycan-binding domain-containing protein [Polyangium aurulentum]UQA56213.1 peptidoglycan-binding protein [Polyangium aurulentum]